MDCGAIETMCFGHEDVDPDGPGFGDKGKLKSPMDSYGDPWYFLFWGVLQRTAW